MDDQQFRQILQYFGLSWGGYRKVRKGVKKRIRRHMHSLGCHDISAYLLELDRSDKLRHECELLMTVSISRFFRDRKLWEVLEAEILPGLIEKRVKKIRVWSAGCASGEEVYSLKEVSEGFRSVYFNAQAGTKLYNIRTLMKSGVIWQLGHLLSDQPACFPSPFLF